MLSPSQRRGVEAEGHCLITACPGSGKTSTLAARAVWLLSQDPTHRVGAVTFTNDAAAELTSRILKQAPRGSSGRVISGTFHKLAKDLLDANGPRVRLASEAQSAEFIRRGWQRYCSNDPIEETILAIQAAKATLYGPGWAPDDPRMQVYLAYESALRERGMVDFQDLLLLSVNGIREGRLPRLDVTHLLVDEVQDADEVQWQFVLLHAYAGIRVTVVGDDDQSIYGWRWAQGYDGMRGFLQATRAEHVSLDTSYRCAPQILEAAARVIENNTERVDKSLQSARQTGEPGIVRIVPCYGTEAAEVAGAVWQASGSWAVLARSNAILDKVEHALIPLGGRDCFTRLGGRSYFDRRGPAMLLAAAQSLAEGRMSGLEALATNAELPVSTLESALGACGGHGPNGLQRFLNHPFNVQETEGAILDQFQRLIREWLREMNKGAIGVAVNNIAMWMESNMPPRALHVPLEPCVKILSKLPGTMDQRLATLRGKKTTENTPRITLSTLHASKGLEFDAAWILGCEQGVLPHSKGDVAEERRLFYVGMTRARNELVMSYNNDGQVTPSVFLLETGLFYRRAA